MADHDHLTTDSAADIAPATMMVGRRAFVFGLQWESAANADSLKRESVASAERAGASHIAFFRRHAQFGLGALPVQRKGNLFGSRRWNSAAAAIAGVVGGSTIAAFKLVDGRCVLIAIGPHGILPDGDAILPSVEHARFRLEELRAGGSAWRRIYAPAEWGIPDSRPDTLQSLLARTRPSALTTAWAVKNRRRIQVGTIGGFALAAALMIAVIRIAAPSDEITVSAPPKPKPPEASWIPAAAGISVCVKAVKDTTALAAIPGWSATFACSPAVGLRVEFASQNGSVSLLRQTVPGVVLSDDGVHAALAIPLTARLPHATATGGFAPRGDYVVAAGEMSQRLAGALAIGMGQRPPLPGEQPPPAPALTTWQTIAWTFATRAPAEVWANGLATLGAIQLDNLTYTPAVTGWQLQGKIYAQP